MHVAGDEETLIPVRVRLLHVDELRDQIDERLATPLAKLSPKRNVSAFPHFSVDQARPRIDDHAQGYIPLSQQVGKSAHVFQRALNSPVYPERGIGISGAVLRQSPASPHAPFAPRGQVQQRLLSCT